MVRTATERWKLRAGNPLNRTARSRSCSSGRKARGGGPSRFCRGIKPRRNARPGAAAGHPGGRSGVLPERSPWRRRPSFSFRSPLFLLSPEFHGSGPVVRLAGGGAHPPWGAGHFLRVPGHSRRGFPHRFAGPGLCRHHLRVGTERSGVRRRSRPRVSPGRPLRFEYLCFAPRAAYTLFACLPAFWGRPGGLRGLWACTGGAQDGCFSPGASPAGGAAPAPSRAPAGLALFCSQSRVHAFCLPPGFGTSGRSAGPSGPHRGSAGGVFLPGGSPLAVTTSSP